jgi:hypothetical protein
MMPEDFIWEDYNFWDDNARIKRGEVNDGDGLNIRDEVQEL